MLHKETVDASTLDLIQRLMADDNAQDFYLVGGTALALMLGHRISIDIDLFTDKPFDAETVAHNLFPNYNMENLETDNNTINCFIENIKVDFIAHCYPLVKPITEIEGIRMASIEDIAAMKMNAIVQNGTRLKDFIDIYFLLEKMPLAKILSAYGKKYPCVNTPIAKKALLYHKDVNLEPKINVVNEKISWQQIVRRLTEANIQDNKIFKPNENLYLKKTLKQRKGPRFD